jgi:hypothetical protein
MGKFGKFILGTAVFGAAAYGVYEYLKDKNGSAAVGTGSPEADEEGSEGGFASQTEEFADRTYTTIKKGASQAADKVKEAIGPKGEKILDVVGESAGKMKDVVLDSAVKVKDIMREDHVSYSTVDGTSSEPEDEEEENAAEDETDDDIMTAVKEEAEKEDTAPKEDAAGAGEGDNSRAAKVEEFFDETAKD